MTLLQPRSWRIGNSDPAVLQAVNQATPNSTLILESDWLTCHTCGNVTKPWLNLAAFAAFTTSDVLHRTANHTAPKFWDVWNEPDTTGTVDQWLQVYDTAYKAIKAADPAAKVVGPSIAAFRVTPPADPSAHGSLLDLQSFAAYAQARGDNFDAISYHDEGNSGGEPIYSPSQLATHAKVLRNILAKYPLLANAKIFVNEYGPVYSMSQPGWIAGDMAALENSGVSQANLTCPTESACKTYYDGLIGEQSQPQLPYWLYLNYAAMSGRVLRVHDTDGSVTALAVRNAKDRTVTLLVGRHDRCGPPPMPYIGGPVPTNTCLAPQVNDAPSVRVPMSVRMHWAHRADGSVRYLGHAMRQPLGENPVLSQPAAHRVAVRLVHGRAQFNLGKLANGDAAIVVLHG